MLGILTIAHMPLSRLVHVAGSVRIVHDQLEYGDALTIEAVRISENLHLSHGSGFGVQGLRFRVWEFCLDLSFASTCRSA